MGVEAEQAISSARAVRQGAPFGLDLSSSLSHVQNTWTKHACEPEALLGEPACVIAAELRATAPGRFTRDGEALDFVADLSERLAR